MTFEPRRVSDFEGFTFVTHSGSRYSIYDHKFLGGALGHSGEGQILATYIGSIPKDIGLKELTARTRVTRDRISEIDLFADEVAPDYADPERRGLYEVLLPPTLGHRLAVGLMTDENGSIGPSGFDTSMVIEIIPPSK